MYLLYHNIQFLDHSIIRVYNLVILYHSFVIYYCNTSIKKTYLLLSNTVRIEKRINAWFPFFFLTHFQNNKLLLQNSSMVIDQLPRMPWGWDRAWSSLTRCRGLRPSMSLGSPASYSGAVLSSWLSSCPLLLYKSVRPVTDSSDHPDLLCRSRSVMTGLMGPWAQAVISTTPLKAHWVVLWLSRVSLKEPKGSPEKEGHHQLCPPLLSGIGLGSRHSHTPAEDT